MKRMMLITAICMVAGAFLSTPQQAAAAGCKKVFEYKVIYMYRNSKKEKNVEKLFNRYGAEGWELVGFSTLYYEGGYDLKSKVEYAAFKRAKCAAATK